MYGSFLEGVGCVPLCHIVEDTKWKHWSLFKALLFHEAVKEGLCVFYLHYEGASKRAALLLKALLLHLHVEVAVVSLSDDQLLTLHRTISLSLTQNDLTYSL